MTIEELRAAQKKAEDQIYERLRNLKLDTGLTPISVDFRLVDIDLTEHRMTVGPIDLTVRLELR